MKGKPLWARSTNSKPRIQRDPAGGVSSFVLVLGVLAAFCGALALSALFAHPAGVSTLPVPGGTPPLATASNVAQPAVAALPTVVDSDVADLVPGAAATPVSSLSQVAPVPALTHLVEPIAESLGSTIGRELTIGLETPASAPAAVASTMPQVVSTAEQSHAAPRTRSSDHERRVRESPSARPRSPIPGPDLSSHAPNSEISSRVGQLARERFIVLFLRK